MYCYLVEKFDIDGELTQSVIGPFNSETESFRVMEREANEEYYSHICKKQMASLIKNGNSNQITLFVNSEKESTYKVLPLEKR